MEHRHPDDEPGAHLLDDERILRVGDARVELDAPVHRPRVHHLLAGAQPLGRHAPARGVLAQAGHVVGAGEHPLSLHPKDVDDVGRLDRRDLARPFAAERLELARNEGRRADERDVGADEPERLDQRAGDPRVEDVADDGDVEALEPAERALDRVEVEESLRRMLMRAVAGVHDRRPARAGDEPGSADVRVPDDDRRRLVGRKRQDGVLQRLPLVHRGARGPDRHRLCGQSLRRQLEARRGPRRGLVEERDHEPAGERRQLRGQLIAIDRGRGRGRSRGSARRRRDRGRRSRAGVAAQARVASSATFTSRTRSTPSVSSSCTWIRSLREVGRFLPT